MTEFSKKVISIIQQIPSGKVTSYGKIAALAGNPRGARMVSRLLSSSSTKHDLPWHRVIGSNGKIAFRNEFAIEEQKSRLEAEGIELSNNRIRDPKFWWNVSSSELNLLETSR